MSMNMQQVQGRQVQHNAVCCATGISFTWQDNLGHAFFTSYAVYPIWASKESIGRLRYAICRPSVHTGPVDARLVAGDVLYIVSEHNQGKGHGLTHTTDSAQCTMILAKLNSELASLPYHDLLRVHKQALAGSYKLRHRSLVELYEDTLTVGNTELIQLAKRGLTPLLNFLLAFISGATPSGRASIASSASEARLNKEERKHVELADKIVRVSSTIPQAEVLGNMRDYLTTLRPVGLPANTGKLWRDNLDLVANQANFANASANELGACLAFFTSKLSMSIAGTGIRFTNNLSQARYQRCLAVIEQQYQARLSGDRSMLVVERADEASADLDF